MDAIKDLVMKWKWQTITLVYRDDRSAFLVFFIRICAYTGIIQLAKFFEDAEIAGVQISLIKIDSDNYLDAAKRLDRAEQCEVTEWAASFID